MENKDSVNYLINKLCLSLLEENEELPIQVQKQALVRKLKALSFQVLLKKSPGHNDKVGDDFEPQRELDVQIFAAKLNSNSRTNHTEVCANFAVFEEQLKAIKTEPYFTTGKGKCVLQLLVALQGNVHEEYEVPIMCPPALLVPGPFTLHADYKNNKHYPTFNDYDIMNPAPKFFKGIQQLKSTDNPYIPKFIFEGEKDLLSAIDNKFITDSVNDEESECIFTGMTRRLLGTSMRININSLQLFPESIKNPTKSIKSVTKPLKSTAFIDKRVKKAQRDDQQTKRIFAWNWEGLACFGILCPKPFAGDANVSLLLQSYIDQSNKSRFEAKILKEKDFIADLKSLTVGIQSDTFQHDEFIVFSLVEPNITIEGVLPATIKCLISDFLECGTCYKRMQTMIMKRGYNLMFEGFMFKALCSAIDEYLLTFRQYVFAKNDEHVLGFFKRMKKMMQQIIGLSYTLAIHPNVDASVKPPMGSQFLGYLYREIMRITENDFIAVLVFVLKRCCHVYFKHLQKWIYYGLLDDPCNELFVGFVDHYRENTKYFYDKAYFIRKEVVPGFFQNFEDQILQCGKYTMLLKAYKPNHPLFDLEYPSISVCLSVEEIEKLESTCKTYFESAQKLCLKAITIREVFESRSEEKRQFFQRMIERSRANLERWTDEQKELALVAAERKKKRLEELSAQLQDAKQRKIVERQLSVEMELKYLREAEKLDEQRMARDNINLRKRIEYYQELHDIINEEEKANKLSLVTPPSVSLQYSPRTPASTAGTDFESCFGEEDEEQASEYEECISEEFVDKFAENEKELNAFLKVSDVKEIEKEKEHTNASLVKQEKSSETMIDTPRKNDNLTVLNIGMKRSVSDVINSNEVPSQTENILQQNRQKAMSGVSMSNCVKTLEVDVQKPATISERADDNLNKNTEKPANLEMKLTEARHNKLKVLTEEFGVVNQQCPHAKSLPDINLNTVADSGLTELQRNRRRMMENDLFSAYNKDPLEARSKLYLDLDSERARNRKKVLESEYNIVTGKSQSVTSAPEITADTPMSTASDDIPLTETVNENESDKDNGNIQKNNTNETICGDSIYACKTSLKLNVSLVHDTSNEATFMTANTLLETTPELALNTAGIMAKQGFSFPDVHQTRNKQQQSASKGIPINNDSLQQEEACPQPDYNNPYRRCQELIATNFKCNTCSPYIRLNSSKKDSANTKKSPTLTEFLTEFLQKSVIIPMGTHLELINNEVMRMFLHDLKVLDHFRSLRNYFFMMDGEFGSIICDGIIGKLEEGAKPEKLLNYQILHLILDTALGSSITGKDKNAENLSFIVNDVPEKFELSSPDVLNNLSLSYRINWPLNLILNPETLEQYANIFKYLVRVRRISWILERAYQILKENVKQNGKAILKSPQYRHVQLIRHKFYHFVHALQNHITANALQASWKTFKDELMTAKSIEDIYRKHANYIKRILFLCMLNKRSAEFYNTIDNVFKISIRFYNNLKSREFKLKPGEDQYTHSRYEKLVNDEIEFNKFIKYTIYLGNKIVRHGYQAEIGEFINLINYNQYYMKSTY